MNILITNIILHNYSGTEVYVRDLAVQLKNSGIHVEIYSPVLGQLAEEIRACDILVVDDITQISTKPDLIHAQHYIPTFEAISRFPDVPLIYFLHDRTHIIDHPPAYHKIVKYVAVDYNCLDRLLIDLNIPEQKTEVLLNWVDIHRFKTRKNYSDKIKKALVFSNYATDNNYFKIIKAACEEEGIILEGIGQGLGQAISHPEEILSGYDVVFAKAKAAMEALATGAAVVVCDFRGLGGMVQSENYSHFRKFNFGMKTMTKTISIENIKKELGKFNPEESQLLAARISEEASLDKYTKKMIQIYKNAISDYQVPTEKEQYEDKRIITEYQSMKTALFQNKIDFYLHHIHELNGIIDDLNQKLPDTDQVQNIKMESASMNNELIAIKNSLSFKLGFAFTYPFRMIANKIRPKK